MTTALTPKIKDKIDQWKANLAELTKRNRLVYFHKDKAPATKIELPASKVFERLVLKPEAISDTELGIEEDIDLGFARDNFKKLRKDTNSILKEKGVNSLFIALGILTWYSDKDKSKEPITSPIFLLPVELEKTPRKNEYKLNATDEQLFLNPALALKLEQDRGITLNQNIESDNEGLDFKNLLDIFRNHKDIDKYVQQGKWKIEETVYLALFQRIKASIIKDLEFLESNPDILTQNSVLLGLANDRSEYELNIPKIVEANNLDKSIDPQSILQILDADSSQQQVIEAAKAGMSFIVQGPPGTGKSQTIVNMVSELIGQRKKILIVAEKPVALKVIFDRLEESDLEDVCLNLSDKDIGSKKNLAKTIYQTKALIERREEEQKSSDFFYELMESRQILNKHPEDLHKNWEPLNKSAFEVYGELLKFERERIPTVNYTFRNINQWSYEKLIKIKTLFQNLSKFYSFFKGDKTTVWANSQLKSLEYEKREEIYREIEELYQQIRLIMLLGDKLAQLLQIDNPKTLAQLEFLISAARHIVDVPIEIPRSRQDALLDNVIASAIEFKDTPKVPKSWLKSNELNFLQHLSNELQQDYELELTLKKYLNDRYSSDFLNQNLSPMLRRCREWGIFRWFKRSYWEDIRLIFQHRKVKGTISDKTIIKHLEKAVDLQNIINKIQSHKYKPNIVFKTFFIRSQPDFFSIKQALIWLEELQNYRLPKDSTAELIYSDNGRRELIDTLNQLKWEESKKTIDDGFKKLRNYFTYPENIIHENSSFFQNIPLDKVQSFLHTAAIELNIFREWLDYQKNLDELKENGLYLFIEELKFINIKPDYWASAFEKSFYYYWLQYIYDHSFDLRNFSPKIHNTKIEQFCELDKKQYDFAKNKLRQMHFEEWQKWSAEATSKPLIAEIDEESQKQKKRYEIRQLIARTHELILSLKPCWLMNPIMVSEYIEPQAKLFDVVIFDEASQIRTEDAVSSIMRAKQVIIVGDKQQMPPSSFFSSVISDDDDEEEQEDLYESLLAESGKFMKDFTLKWHYRSQDESLIDFSNRKFYESQLITFPNPIRDGSRGVSFHYVENGLYEPGKKKRCNKPEAEAVARLVLEHVQTNNKLTLGIIAFSKQQASTIEKEIETLSASYPSITEFCQDDSTKFFVKNLENVQGDERDVIILSFGYGKDENDKFDRRFGPLNQEGGQRRLNVAITRAKYKLVLVASITPDLLSGVNSDGVRYFQEYFEYVQNAKSYVNVDVDSNVKSNHKFHSALIEDIYYVLREHGYEVETNIGCSSYRIDLAVLEKQQPKEYLLAIESDGLTYNKYPTARDRDRLRRTVLEKNLKWKIYRIWSKDWFHNRYKQIKLLIEQIERLKAEK
ncbi:hypothetical protein NIES4071_72230 [Calothrix sp. NIES-4071]|nr:hypothetical protein NIES4071_72230 [Calothrix sp. NIES-4071]BAZ61498.1 hypothetical protein NIES4105_72180 [Calothrix sp. NIES-4105]